MVATLIEIDIPKPKGFITVSQDDSIIFENLFTDYGLRQTYKSGKNTILDTNNGGIFRYLHIGSSSVPITINSTGLTTPTNTATRLGSTLTYTTDTNTNVRYAVFTTTWRFAAGISSFQEIGMSNNANGTMGLLCGRTLNGPLALDPASTTTITYLVQIPILSGTGVLDSGNITIDGVDYPFTLEGTFHVETATQVNSILPIETTQVVSGNLSRMFVNNSVWENGKSSYACTVQTGTDNFNYFITQKIVNYDPTVQIVNINIGNSDPNSLSISNFPVRIVFGSPPTKPIGLDMTFEFNILINLIN